MAKKARTPARASPYDVHPGVAMIQKWTAELPAKTGRSLEEWVALLRAAGPADDKGRRAWLKDGYGQGGNTAAWLAEVASDTATWDGDPEAYLRAAAVYVEGMYAGPKAALRPLHDRLVALGRALGPDVKVCPCKTIVPLYRRHVFAEIKPATRTRIDFGLALGPGVPFTDRLTDTGGLAKKDRITHRVAVTAPGDIDADVAGWLRAAYERDGPAAC